MKVTFDFYGLSFKNTELMQTEDIAVEGGKKTVNIARNSLDSQKS
jgi:hypothetical protein